MEGAEPPGKAVTQVLLCLTARRDNLDVDMTYWRQRGRLKANATMELYEQIMKRRLTAVFKLVLVYKVRRVWRGRG